MANSICINLNDILAGRARYRIYVNPSTLGGFDRTEKKTKKNGGDSSVARRRRRYCFQARRALYIGKASAVGALIAIPAGSAAAPTVTGRMHRTETDRARKETRLSASHASETTA